MSNTALPRRQELCLWAAGFFWALCGPLAAEAVRPAPPPALHLDHVSVEDGLSHSSVWSIRQDSDGFMWFATEQGLNRYDGYAFEIFRNDPEDTDPGDQRSLSHGFLQFPGQGEQQRGGVERRRHLDQHRRQAATVANLVGLWALCPGADDRGRRLSTVTEKEGRARACDQ